MIDDLLPLHANGFWHVPLDDDGSLLSTFSTPWGRFRWTRMQFQGSPRRAREVIYWSEWARVLKKSRSVVRATVNQQNKQKSLWFVTNCRVDLKAHLARHGIPDLPMSANGQPSSSAKFQEFANTYGLEHVTSSPLYAQSNGKAESPVKTDRYQWFFLPLFF